MDAVETNPARLERERRLDAALEAFLTPERSPMTSRDEALLGRGTTLGLDGGLAVSAWGEGPTVLLAHGWSSRGTHWGAYVDALTAAGCRALAVDAPGHGASPGDRCHVLEYAARLGAVAGQVGPIAGVLGHSFGAGALVLALDRGLRAGRVALLAGPSSLAGVVERWGRAWGLAEADLLAFVGRVERVVGTPIGGLDLARIVGKFDQPALIVHDRGDDEVPLADGRAMAAAWPGARLLITERLGHRRIMIAREVVRSVAAFLAERPPRTE